MCPTTSPVSSASAAGLAFDTVQLFQHLDGDDNEDPTEAALLAGIDEVAAALGNTRAVCRKYYIHPAIIAAYLDGTLTQSLTAQTSRPTGTGLNSEEAAVLRLLKHRSAAA